MIPLLAELKRQGLYAAAEEQAIEFLARNPGDYAVLDFLAQGMYEQGRYAESLVYLYRMEKHIQDAPGWKSNALQCHFLLGKILEALPLAESLVKTNPENVTYVFYYSLCLSAVGRFEESYAVLEGVPSVIRGMDSQKARALLRRGLVEEAMELVCLDEQFAPLEKIYSAMNLDPHKRYRRGAALEGKKIAVLSQGGLGDAVATVRFTKILHDRGARVFVVCDPLLWPLFKTLPWPVECRSGEALRPEEYDHYMSNASSNQMIKLNYFDPSLDIPFPYLASDPNRRKRWRPIIDSFARGRPKIAIHWEGHRGTSDARPLRDVPYRIVREFGKLGALYSFQRGGALGAIDSRDSVCELGSRFETLEDTAAALDQMDYVVTGDAFLAHLAGALNKQTALLLHVDHFMLWIRGEKQSLWYPSIHMFRQPRFGDWDTVGKEAFAWLKSELERN